MHFPTSIRLSEVAIAVCALAGLVAAYPAPMPLMPMGGMGVAPGMPMGGMGMAPNMAMGGMGGMGMGMYPDPANSPTDARGDALDNQADAILSRPSSPMAMQQAMQMKRQAQMYWDADGSQRWAAGLPPQ